MTTTPEVPMPEPDYTVFWHPYKAEYIINSEKFGGEMVFTGKKLRAYAAARCAALQAERDDLCRQNEEILARNVELDKAMGAMEAERDALAEKVKALQDDARRYRWLRESATISWNGYVEYDCLAGGDAEREQMDAAIDAAGGGGDG